MPVALLALFMMSACGPGSSANTDCSGDRQCDVSMDMGTGSGQGDMAFGVGASCVERSCTDSLICTRITEQESVCLEGCEVPGEACDGGRGECVAARSEAGEASPVCFVGNIGVGQSCASDLECGDGLVCLRLEGEERGVCSPICDEPLSLCVGGEVCMPTQRGGQSEGLCYAGGPLQEGARCDAFTDCGRGLRCLSAGEEKFCVRACEQDADCQGGAQCVAQQEAAGGGAICRPAVGAACVSDSVCPESTTCSKHFSDPFFMANLWPDGACSSEGCTLDGADCATGSACRPLTGSDMIDTVCAQTCESDADCRITQGWRCLDASMCDTNAEGCLSYFGSRRLCARPDRLWVLK